jgi:hypothetical protein
MIEKLSLPAGNFYSKIHSSMLIAVQDLLKLVWILALNDENGNAEVENPTRHLKTLLEASSAIVPINEGEDWCI